MTSVYLDYNATAPLRSCAAAIMHEAFSLLGNASSTHSHGRAVRQKIEQARHSIASYFQRPAADLLFTSGATEANNLVLKGFNGTVITSSIEHDSVLRARADALICPVTATGIVDLCQLESLISTCNKPLLISIMAANNETGVIQPLDEIANLSRQYGALLHVDAVQAVGKLSISWATLGCDFISLSAHKIGGPAGVGALIIRNTVPLKALQVGGGQERSYRAGTENLLGIFGFAAAMNDCVNDNWDKIGVLRDQLEHRLLSLGCGVEIYGAQAPRLANTSNILMPGVKNNLQVMDFDLKGISLSAGSACSSGKVKTSHVLKAMGITTPDIDQSIRVSLGCQTTQADIDYFLTCWTNLYQRTHSSAKQRIAS